MQLLQKQSVTRLLQAFSTYNEVMGYRTDMIVTACDYLRVWCGDEDKAFESFVSPITMNYRVCVMLHAEMTLCDPNV